MKKYLFWFALLLAVLGWTIPKLALASSGVDIITAAGNGGGPHIRSFDTKGNPTDTSFFAYNKNFRGGVRVATGDVNGDGVDEIIAGAGPGGGPHVRVFDLSGNWTGWDMFPFHPDFRGGVDVATGDADGDGIDEIAVSQFSQGQCWVKVYKYDAPHTILGEWNAFGPFEGGGTVSLGDVDGDGKDEVIVGAGPGGGPHVRVFEANGTWTGWDMFPFHPDFRGGVDVASSNVDTDGKDEIGVCQLSQGEAWCKVYEYDIPHTILGEWLAYPRGVECGANLAMFDTDKDGEAEIVTGAGYGGGPQVRVFEANGTVLSTNFFAYSESFRGGINVDLTEVSSLIVNSVIDGDTIKLSDGRTIRYIGINTSEKGQPYYSQANLKNKELVEGKTVTLKFDKQKTDIYGRTLAYVFVGDVFVNLELLRQGYAHAWAVYPDVMYADLFSQAEKEARERDLGIWARSKVQGLDITSLNADAPGNDHNNLNGEWIEIKNFSNQTINLNRFSLYDKANSLYYFPSFNLSSGSKVKVFSGCGTNTGSKLYWCSSRAIWNNDEDTAYLRDKIGEFIDWYSYGNQF